MGHTIQSQTALHKLFIVSLASIGLLAQGTLAVMADDNSTNVAVSSLNTNKSRYSPNEPVTLQIGRAHV